jgi:hypothetical protein
MGRKPMVHSLKNCYKLGSYSGKGNLACRRALPNGSPIIIRKQDRLPKVTT